MKRRRFLGVLGATAAMSPFAALAQRPAVPVIGYLHSGSPYERKHQVEGFRQGLKESGFVDGKDVFIEYRWAESHMERLPELAAELAGRQVAVIAAIGGLRPALAAKKATSTIPIVFTGGDDPVKAGLVASLSRPGGNVTGVTNIAVALDAKRLEVLHDLVPKASRIAYLVNPSSLAAESSVKSAEAAAKAAHIKLQVLIAGSDQEIEAAFAAMKKNRSDALLVGANTLFTTQRARLVALASRHALPAAYAFREFPQAGGLMSYGPDISEVSRQAGRYTASILKGANPATLPVLQIEKFELVVNLKTAKALGLKIPRDFLARIDYVIE